MVAALNQDRFTKTSPAADVPYDIDECYMSLDIDSAGLQSMVRTPWHYTGAVNTIREMSRALVAAGIKNIRFAPDNPNGSFRNTDTLHVSIFDLERAKFKAFLERAGIDVSQADVFRGKIYDSPAEELRASLARREKRRETNGFHARRVTDTATGIKARVLSLLPDSVHMSPAEINAKNERLVKQREFVACYTVRKHLGNTCDVEFIDEKKTQFVVVDAEGKRTLYVGRISEKPIFTVEIFKAKLRIEKDGQIVYKGRARVVFSGKVRNILEGVGEED